MFWDAFFSIGYFLAGLRFASPGVNADILRVVYPMLTQHIRTD